MEITHPLQNFLYCPICGNKTFIPYNEKAKKCTSCSFVYFFNSSAAVAAFIVNKNDELLVCCRAKDPYKQTLDLPGGFVDMNETAEEASYREIKEELNLAINKITYCFSLPNIYPFSGFEVHTLDLFFECKINSFSELRASDDVSEAFFIKKEKINIDDFGLASIRKGLSIYLNRI